MKVLTVLLFFTFTVQASAQTLAEAARKERARQKTVVGQSKGIFTNATAAAAAHAAPAAPGAPATPAAATAAADASKPAGPVDRQGHDENYWKDLFQKARDASKLADEKFQLQEAKVKDLNTQLLRQSDIYNRENVLGPQITAAKKELDATKLESEKAKSKISDLEQELRSAGGMPGWAR